MKKIKKGRFGFSNFKVIVAGSCSELERQCDADKPIKKIAAKFMRLFSSQKSIAQVCKKVCILRMNSHDRKRISFARRRQAGWASAGVMHLHENH